MLLPITEKEKPSRELHPTTPGVQKRVHDSVQRNVLLLKITRWRNRIELCYLLLNPSFLYPVHQLYPKDNKEGKRRASAVTMIRTACAQRERGNLINKYSNNRPNWRAGALQLLPLAGMRDHPRLLDPRILLKLSWVQNKSCLVLSYARLGLSTSLSCAYLRRGST